MRTLPWSYLNMAPISWPGNQELGVFSRSISLKIRRIIIRCNRDVAICPQQTWQGPPSLLPLPIPQTPQQFPPQLRVSGVAPSGRRNWTIGPVVNPQTLYLQLRPTRAPRHSPPQANLTITRLTLRASSGESCWSWAYKLSSSSSTSSASPRTATITPFEVSAQLDHSTAPHHRPLQPSGEISLHGTYPSWPTQTVF